MRRSPALGHVGRLVDRSGAQSRGSGARGAGGDRLRRVAGASPLAFLWRAWAGALGGSEKFVVKGPLPVVYKGEGLHEGQEVGAERK